ncbi:MAG: zinc dependent phospholipase C family protein [Bacilli bacterium]|jgi:hypothetical protein|nr:zinc dependent phospholipase C family protein [Bacilli bacterium]
MPAFAAHYVFSREVYKKLSPDIKELIKKYKESVDYYDLGAQGPDIFFFYKPYKKNNISSYGSSLHRKRARNLFVNAIERVSKEEEWTREMLMVYLFGLCNHFTLDSCAHPIINKATKNFSEHMLLESELDRKVIHRYITRFRDKEHRYRRQYCINSTLKYGYYLNLVYPEIDVKKCQEAVYQTRFYMAKLYSPYFIKGAIIKTLSKKFAKGNDFSNMIIKKVPDTTFDKTNLALMNDWDKFIDIGVKNVTNLYEYYLGKAKLSEYFNKNFE